MGDENYISLYLILPFRGSRLYSYGGQRKHKQESTARRGRGSA